LFWTAGSLNDNSNSKRQWRSKACQSLGLGIATEVRSVIYVLKWKGVAILTASAPWSQLYPLFQVLPAQDTGARRYFMQEASVDDAERREMVEQIAARFKAEYDLKD